MNPDECFSRVRIEMHEGRRQVGTKTGVLLAQEAGTTGDVDVGSDIAYALDVCPRPTQELARAILVREERRRLESSPEERALYRAALAVIQKWEKLDELRDGDLTTHEKIQALKGSSDE